MNIRYILSRLKDPKTRVKIDSRFGIGKLENLYYKNWFNPFATIWVNFRSFPFRQAIKFPFWVYGRPRFYSLSGKMRINGKVTSGLIKFNIVKPGAPGNMSTQSEIQNLGEIIFDGRCDIGTGNKIMVSYGAELCLGNNTVIADNTSFGCHKYIRIGEGSRIANRSQIMDTDFHFIADLNKKIIRSRFKPIIIGKYCWICNGSYIMKGSKIPDYAIVSGNSYVNKDFSDATGGCIIAGSPATVKKTGIVRVFNTDIEDKIWKFWNENPDIPFPIYGYSIEDLTRYN